KGSIQVVTIHQLHHPAPEPDAFGVTGRAINGLRSFGELVASALIVLNRVVGIGGGLPRLVPGAQGPAPGIRAADTHPNGEARRGQAAQGSILNAKHRSTHKFPDSVSGWRSEAAIFLPPK